MMGRRILASVVVLVAVAGTACGGESENAELEELRNELEATRSQLEELQESSASGRASTSTTERATTTSSPPKTSTTTTTTTSAPPTTLAAAAPASSAGGTRSNPWPLGSTHSTGEWDATIISVDFNANERIASANSFNDPPQPGYKYVIIRVRATYNGSEEGVPWIDLSLTLAGDDQRQYDDNECGAVEPDSFSDQPNVYAGGTVEGDVCVQIPTGLGDVLAFVEESSFAGKPVWWATS